MIIFSVAQGQSQTADINNHALVIEKLYKADKKAIVIDGCYRGKLELSYLTKNTDLGIKLAKQYNQETYLERGHYGFWYLIDVKTGKVIDGFRTICEVKEEVAKIYDCYSMLRDRYYIGIPLPGIFRKKSN